jgi:hypothetical protein
MTVCQTDHNSRNIKSLTSSVRQVCVKLSRTFSKGLKIFATELFSLRGVVFLNFLPVELYLIYCAVDFLTCVVIN